MSNTNKTSKPKNGMYRVRLDERTIVHVNNLSSLKLWKEKYPELKIIDNKD